MMMIDTAFLLSEPHVTAMFQCLEALEQNNPKLLALVDTVAVGHARMHAHAHARTRTHFSPKNHRHSVLTRDFFYASKGHPKHPQYINIRFTPGTAIGVLSSSWA